MLDAGRRKKLLEKRWCQEGLEEMLTYLHPAQPLHSKSPHLGVGADRRSQCGGSPPLGLPCLETSRGPSAIPSEKPKGREQSLE